MLVLGHEAADGRSVKLSRERRVLLGLAGAGALALGVDRAFFKPSGASAEGIAPEASQPANVPPHPHTALAEAVTSSKEDAEGSASEVRTPLAQRLRDAAANQGPLDHVVVDAFAEPKAQAAMDLPQRRKAEEFVRTHRLTTVISSADGGVAMVNGKPVRVGQSLDGFTLVRIERLAAVFVGDGVELRLVVAEAPSRGTDPRTSADHRP